MILKSSVLFFCLIHLLNTDAQNVFRAAEGGTVHLPCHSPPESSLVVSVEWTKHTTDSKNVCKCNIDKITWSSSVECIPRFTFSVSFMLSLENVQPSDSGNYSCKTMRLIPPPTVDKSSSLELQVAGVSLQRLNISNNDSCVDLRCSLEGLKTPEPANFTWSRGGQMLLHAATFNDTRSELSLCKPDWSDGDTITCHVDYSGSKTQKSIKLEPQHPPDKESRDDFPVVFVALFSIFIISISFIWILFCMFKHKTLTCCRGASTEEERRTKQ